MAKIVQSLTRATKEYEQTNIQSLVRDLDGIMSVVNNTDNTNDDVDGDDVDGDGDVDQTDDFIFRYFDKTGKTLQAGAGGVEDLMAQIRKRLSNMFTT